MMRTFESNGLSLSYREEGSGVPLVLIHGFCGSSRYWQEVIPALAQHFRVIAPDLRGHGDSSAPIESYTMDVLADDLARLLEHLELPRVIMLGHSLGGYVTLAFANRYPNKLAGFGLIHSTAYPDDEKGRENRQKGMESIRENGMEPFIRALVPKLFAPDHLAAMPEAVQLAKEIGNATDPQAAIRTLEGMRDRPDRHYVLRKPELPILLVAGENDQIIPVEKSFSVDAPHVHRELIPSAGHMSMLEAPEELCKMIRQFMTIIPSTI
jgi:3-oxoadipate enol-lactonase